MFSIAVMEGGEKEEGGGATGFLFSSYKQAVEFPQVLASIIIVHLYTRKCLFLTCVKQNRNF